MYMHYGAVPFSGAFGLFGGWLSIILFWAFIGLHIAIFVKMLMHDKEPYKTNKKDTALQILKERYAKGEVTKKEFEAIKKDLED